MSARSVREKRKQVVQISTGSNALDELLVRYHTGVLVQQTMCNALVYVHGAQ